MSILKFHNSLLLNGSIHSYAIRTYNKRNGPYYLVRIDPGGKISFVEKLETLEGFSKNVADDLIQKGDELFKGVEKVVSHYVEHL